MFNISAGVKLLLLMISGSSISFFLLVSLYTKLAFQDSMTADKISSAMANMTLNVTDVAEDSKIHDKEKTSCRKLMMTIAKRLMKVLNGCTKELKEKYPDKEEFHKHFQCSIQCFMSKTNMIDKFNRFSNATFNTFLLEQIPLRYHNMAFKLTTNCISVYASKITGVGDPHCLTYGDFVKCLQSDVADKCANNIQL